MILIDTGLAAISDFNQKLDVLKWLYELEKDTNTDIALGALQRAVILISQNNANCQLQDDNSNEEMKNDLLKEIVKLNCLATLSNFEKKAKIKLPIELKVTHLLISPMELAVRLIEVSIQFLVLTDINTLSITVTLSLSLDAFLIICSLSLFCYRLVLRYVGCRIWNTLAARDMTCYVSMTS